MNRATHPALAAAPGALALLAGPVLLGQAPGQAGATALAAAVTGGLAAYRIGRADLGGLAASLVALSVLTLGASPTLLLVGLAPVAALLLPRVLATRRLHGVLLALVLAGAASALLLDGLAQWGAALAGGALFALVRPERPTRETLRGVGAASLLVPAGGLAVLLVLNVLTGGLEPETVRDALGWSLGAAALAWTYAAGGLGLAVLLESDAAWQGPAWAGLGAVLSVVAASALARDPSVTIGLAAGGLPLVAVLASLVVGRLGAGAPRRSGLAAAVMVLLVLGQSGLTL